MLDDTSIGAPHLVSDSGAFENNVRICSNLGVLGYRSRSSPCMTILQDRLGSSALKTFLPSGNSYWNGKRHP
jgi:hypothetical protein